MSDEPVPDTELTWTNFSTSNPITSATVWDSAIKVRNQRWQFWRKRTNIIAHWTAPDPDGYIPDIGPGDSFSIVFPVDDE